MGPITTILVDDEPEALERLEFLLNYFKEIKILAKFTNVDKALEGVIKLKPDIVFIDVEMPEKNGFEFVREIKDKNVFPAFIFVTAYEQYAIKAIKESAFDYLIKPIDIDELSQTIKRFSNRKEEKLKKELPFKLKKLYNLTDREIEIVQQIAEGKTSKQIADLLFISVHTVETHRRNILKKTGKHNIDELIVNY
jgi:DNA-binding NarL/FixJ family response regulator